jgi:hypothetical protein
VPEVRLDEGGALCPCPACQAGSTGDFNLDVAFSSHRLSHHTLEQLGAVIKAIGARTSDSELRFWAFMHYVSTRHPEILTVDLKSDVRKRVEAVLAGLVVPPVEVRPPPRLTGWVILLWVAALAAGAWWLLSRG